MAMPVASSSAAAMTRKLKTSPPTESMCARTAFIS